MIPSTLRKRSVGRNTELSSICSAYKNESLTQPQDDDDPAQNRDLISQLPDEIFIKILGYVPISCATSTSILSTRWRDLYKQVPNIDLNCSDLLRRVLVDCGSSFLSQTNWTNLHRFVSKMEWEIGYFWGVQCVHQDHTDLIISSLDRFLSLRSGFKIHSARLNCCCLGKSVTTRFDQCIYSLGRLGIEKLVLHCSCRGYGLNGLVFSSQILVNMPSLKYFELGFCNLVPNLRGQCNSSLQTLVLFEISLDPGALECILSNCPSLRALTIRACYIYSSKLTIRGPNLELKYLNIYDCYGRYDEIVLCANNLLVFKFSGYKRKFIFDHVPQLQSVYLDTPRQTGLMHYVCGKLANDLPHLKSLQLVHAFYPFQGIIDMFNNLRRLDLTLITPEMTDLLVLTPLLQNFPLLQEFHLSKLDPDNFYFSPRGEKQDIVLHSELKKVEITGFIGTENDVEFALYILKSAIKLEEMHVTPCTKKRVGYGRWNRVYEQGLWSEERQRTILTRLQGHAVSKTAQLLLQHKYQNISAIEEDCHDYD